MKTFLFGSGASLARMICPQTERGNTERSGECQGSPGIARPILAGFEAFCPAHLIQNSTFPSASFLFVVLRRHIHDVSEVTCRERCALLY
jgi:hypothetical protein